jgi:hypothetical protein
VTAGVGADFDNPTILTGWLAEGAPPTAPPRPIVALISIWALNVAAPEAVSETSLDDPVTTAVDDIAVGGRRTVSSPLATTGIEVTIGAAAPGAARELVRGGVRAVRPTVGATGPATGATDCGG